MEELLKQLKIKANVVKVETNNVMTKYYLRLQPGGKLNSLERCSNELVLGLKAYSAPIIKLIPEQGLISVELITKKQELVSFFDLQDSLINSDHALPIILGKTCMGEDLIEDLAKMTHILVAGTTGSGKSVLLHSIICSLINGKRQVKLALIDPKNVEFSNYTNINHLLYSVANYADEAYSIIDDLIDIMEDRFKLMSAYSVNEIGKFNDKKPKKSFPYIVLVIDEFSDLMMMSKKEFQVKLSRLAQKGRACGIHIIVGTQRPDAGVVSGVVKACMVSRISCKVISAVNSRVILDQNGAEKLLGKGDALLNSFSHNMTRFQGAYISPKDVQMICENNKRSLLNRMWNRL